MPHFTIKQFQNLVLQHYQEHGRKNLPWKKTRDPYKILVSEIMLQQTQVSRVLPKYRQFLQEFPTIKTLTQASDAKLLKVWQGLGYWRRAKYLKLAAQKTITDPTLSKFFRVKGSPSRPHSGTPEPELGDRMWGGGKRANKSSERSRKNSDAPVTQLQKLPGVGPYTARAVACFAFGNCEPFIDTNIRRVFLHFFFKDKKNVSDKDILKVAQRALYAKNPRLWHYALFDYGATALKDKKINRRSKHYAKQSQFTGSFRSLRTSVVQLLLKEPTHTITQKRLQRFLQTQITAQNMSYIPKQVVGALLKDKLIKAVKTGYQL